LHKNKKKAGVFDFAVNGKGGMDGAYEPMSFYETKP